MRCIYCNGKCIKKGKQSNKQRYLCKECKKYQQQTYEKVKIDNEKVELLKNLNNEGMGISSMSRVLRISKSSAQRIIQRVSTLTRKPGFRETEQSYEIDELRTYVGNKKNECWVIYAINKHNGKIIDLIVGRRTKLNLSKVVNSVLKLNPKRIYTDGLNIYRSLIPKSMHRVFQFSTNKIERKNLTLRTHLKRLARRTICYSKNETMLEACLKVYFWG